MSTTAEALFPSWSEEDIISAAEYILRKRLEHGKPLISPLAVEKYLRVKLSGEPAERFFCVWLDNRHRVIAMEVLCDGTVDSAQVPTREVVRACLKHNAAAVVLAHNHPSGVAEPSASDRSLTHRLKDALGMVGCRVLDHIVVGQTCTSMAARGLI